MSVLFELGGKISHTCLEYLLSTYYTFSSHRQNREDIKKAKGMVPGKNGAHNLVLALEWSRRYLVADIADISARPLPSSYQHWFKTDSSLVW